MNPDYTQLDEVTRMFANHTADTWAKAMTRLDFQEPGLVGAALRWALQETVLDTPILDAGCGTGLCGPLIRNFSRRVEGVDLSASMLESAKESGYYEAVHCSELVQFLREHEGYGAIVASGVCCFISDLRPLFAGARHALVDDGLFVFTIDLHDGPEPVVVSPRHAAMTLHNPKHMLAEAHHAGFELRQYQRCRMRNDFYQLQPIDGAVVVLKATNRA